MGLLFSKCSSSKKCKYCGIREDYFASDDHRSRPSCRDSPDKMLLDDFNVSNSQKRKSVNGYHHFI